MKSNYDVRVGDREKHGDTYEKYCQRCQVVGIEPKDFRDWLGHEIAMATRRGGHVTLDDHQRFDVRSGEQLQA